MLAAAVYAVVPPFVPVLERLGTEMPPSARMLVAAYPFAILLPLATAAAGMALRARPARLLVPLTYVVAAGIAAFVGLALSVPMFELS